MSPKQIAFCAALVFASHGSGALEEADLSSLLQHQMRQEVLQNKRGGSHLLETAHTIISKINAGDDPSDCAVAADAARSAVEEAIPSIVEQHAHMENQINIAAQNVESCSNPELEQQGVEVQQFREDHQTCRQAEHDLEDPSVCQLYDEARNSLQSRCYTFPENGYREALRQARDELDAALNQADLLGGQCDDAHEALATQQAECAAAQRSFEEAYCERRVACEGAQSCYENARDTYMQIVNEIQAALTVLREEYQLFKHVECLLGHADEALNQGSIVSGDALSACAEPANTDELTIDPQEFVEQSMCETEFTSQAPCLAGFFEAEYSNLPQRESIEAACTQCTGLSAPASTSHVCSMEAVTSGGRHADTGDGASMQFLVNDVWLDPRVIAESISLNEVVTAEETLPGLPEAIRLIANGGDAWAYERVSVTCGEQTWVVRSGTDWIDAVSGHPPSREYAIQ